MEKVCFYTTGECFTNLMNDFLSEGRFKAVYESLEDGGLPIEAIIDFFMGRGYFTGDSRDELGLSFLTKEEPANQSHRWYWAMRNFIQNHKNPKIDEDDEGCILSDYLKYPKVIDALSKRAWEENEDLQYLHKVITRESLIQLIWKEVLSEYYTLNPAPETNPRNGVILDTGDFLECDYAEHGSVYPILYRLNLASADDWYDDTRTMHISSAQISGSCAYSLKNPNSKDDDCGINDAQLSTILKYKNSISHFYGGKRIMETIRKYFSDVEDHGGKYNNLAFLRRCYDNLNLPLFSKEPIEGVRNCLRTSPKYSLPGLLESKFEVNEQSIKEMEQRYETYKDIREGNKFHFFYQQFIEGVNGVCHRNRSGFSYAIGDEQGDVVSGKVSGKRLSRKDEGTLREIADMIHHDLDESLQLEFVVTPEGKVFIVQLRILENDVERTVGISAPANVLIKGRTFSKGCINDLTADDILIVDKDAPSEALLGKKALIVKSMVEFSHILALSQALKIPSVYGTGDFKLPDHPISIQAYNTNGYIYK